jgi:tetratricopeptide (TPR) repeat protein
MASNVPVVQQIAWAALLPQSVVLISIGVICFLYGAQNPVLPAVAIYFLIGYTLRHVIAKDQRKGLELVKKRDYAGAIPAFEASYKFFAENLWLDKYRYVTLLNPSSMSYRGMALNNMAFCYSQIGEGKKAAAYFRQVLDLYPENGIAQAGLNAVESANR